MQVRPTQASNYALVRAGLAINLSKLIRAQEEVSSGKRILRPSDDPVGNSTAMALKRQLGVIARFQDAARTAKPTYDAGIAALEEAQSLFAEARSLVLEGMNGTLNAHDRETLATSIRLLRQRLFELGNTKFQGDHLFAGTASDAAPFEERNGRVVYAGDTATRSIQIGFDTELALNLPGDAIFGSFDPTGTAFTGDTGAAVGSTADEGTGYGYLTVRHLETLGAVGAGIALVDSGSHDTFLGDRMLVVDATLGTVRWGDGTAVAIPSPTSAEAADFVLTDEHGAELHLDFTGYTGGTFRGVLTGTGSISLDGVAFTLLDFSDADLAVRDTAAERVVHVDTTSIVRAGTELVSFGGTVNAFDVLQGVVEDLENVHDLDVDALTARLGSRLSELDRNQESLLSAATAFGAQSQRLQAADLRLADLDLSLKSLLSDTEDADLSSVILDMTQAEQTLQLAQATGARLLQQSLLDYL